MEFKQVIAIIPNEALPPLQARLSKLQVEGITASRVMGYGEYKNLFRDDAMTEHTKVEIFIAAPKLDAVIEAMVELERGNPPGAGVVAVVPVERFLHLRTGSETLPDAHDAAQA